MDRIGVWRGVRCSVFGFRCSVSPESRSDGMMKPQTSVWGTRPPIITSRGATTGVCQFCCLFVICHLSFVICHLSFVICHLSLVIGHWSLFIGHWSQLQTRSVGFSQPRPPANVRTDPAQGLAFSLASDNVLRRITRYIKLPTDRPLSR